VSYLNFSWILEGALAGAQGPTSRRDLLFFHRNDIRAIVRMEEHTISGEAWNLVDLYEPVPDFAAPALDQIERMVRFIEEQTETWERPVVVTCHAGLGRTGTVLACYMVSVGYTPRKAIEHVRGLRPGSVQNPEQEQAVHQYSALLKRRERETRRKAREALDDR
jgi:atypical dual specificity phosphatase